MITVNYENFPDEMLMNWFKYLTGRVFKILPLSENSPDTLRNYMESLMVELTGSKALLKKIRYDGNFMSLLSTLQYFIDNECKHDVYKREVFKCIDLIQKIQTQYFKKED
jgi:hypothetical protein